MNIIGNYNMLISWIIIGKNWLPEAPLLIESLNKQNINSDLVELILIDDGSDDKSVDALKNISYKNKQIISLDSSNGRCHARNCGINLASGKFCLFTNSNIIPEKDFLSQYIQILSNPNLDGAAGIINYSSSDDVFENYLNNSRRGLKKLKAGELLPIEYVLFGNCAIKTKLLRNISGFNEKLNGYGGEEIELLNRINQTQELRLVKIDANSIRINHPGFNVHCNRLIEFGKTNFKLLDSDIQQKIIPNLFLKFYKFLPIYIMIMKLVLINQIIRGKSFLVIRSIMGLSIIRGYKS